MLKVERVEVYKKKTWEEKMKEKRVNKKWKQTRMREIIWSMFSVVFFFCINEYENKENTDNRQDIYSC